MQYVIRSERDELEQEHQDKMVPLLQRDVQ